MDHCDGLYTARGELFVVGTWAESDVHLQPVLELVRMLNAEVWSSTVDADIRRRVRRGNTLASGGPILDGRGEARPISCDQSQPGVSFPGRRLATSRKWTPIS